MNAEPAAQDPSRPLLPQARRLGTATLAGLIYFTACGGAYGLEPLVGAVGPGWAVAFILATPLVYSLPIALMAAELVALMPDEGGYYVWVRESFGRFWAVQEAWWTMVFGLFQLASFPVLFASYLSFVLAHAGGGIVDPGLLARPVVQWGIACAVVASGTALNLFGALDVGRSALVATALVLAGFLAFLGTWFASGAGLGHAASVIASDLATDRHDALLLGLSVVVYNYSGWDKACAYSGEVDNPQRAYPRALALALGLAVVSYLLPVVAGVGATTDPKLWTAEQGWPAIAGTFAGGWLGVLLAVGGMVSMWSLFNGTLLWVSRIPAVLALDGWLPRWLAPAEGGNAVPVGAVLLTGLLVAGLAAFSFSDLVIVQSLFYMSALALEFLALLWFRAHHADAPRSFRVPGGRWGLALTCIAPALFGALVVVAALRDSDSYGMQLGVCAGVAAIGVLLWFPRRRTAGRGGARHGGAEAI